MSADQNKSLPAVTHVWAQLWRMTAGVRWPFLAAVAVMFAEAMFAFCVPLIGQATIDGALRAAGDAESLPGISALTVQWLGGAQWVADHLWLPGLLMFALGGLAGGMNFLRGRWTTLASERIAASLRCRLFDHLQCVPAGALDDLETGDLVQRCTSDVETVRAFFAVQAAGLIHSLLLLVVAVPVMLYMDWPMGLVALVSVPLLVGFTIGYFGLLRRRFKEADEAEGALTTRLQENLTGIRVVRAFARQDYEIERFDQCNDHLARRVLTLYRAMAFYWSVSDLLTMGQQALILSAGVYWLYVGRLSVGEVYAFMAWAHIYLWPVRMMGRMLMELGKAQVSAGRMGQILALPVEQPVAGVDHEQPVDTLVGRIEIEQLSFGYQDQAPVLHDIHLKIDPGQTVALLGPSGAGKSTLIHLLLRFYDYRTGSIRLDGRDLQTLDRKQLRRQFAVVLQEPYLYARSIEENIRFGRHEATDEQLQLAAEMACVHHAIQEFEDDYKTVIGERGVTLSGGQRQRLAIARALVREAPVLILDDALSAVDNRTQQQIVRTLAQRHGRRTTLLVAHRLSTLQLADQIVVMDAGRIVQQGRHEQLIAEPGMYRDLWHRQMQTGSNGGEESRQ